MNRLQAQNRVTAIIAKLAKQDASIANDFAESVALHAVMLGIPANECRFTAWLGGPEAADKLRDQLAALPNE